MVFGYVLGALIGSAILTGEILIGEAIKKAMYKRYAIDIAKNIIKSKGRKPF